MIPILYERNENKFDSNGLGMLADAVQVSVRQEVKGLSELRLTYHASGKHYGQIKPGAIIMVEPDSVTRPQPYRIYKVQKGIGDTVTADARHIAYDAIGIPVSPYTAQNAAGAFAGIRTNAATACPFEFTTDSTSSDAFTVTEPVAAWELLRDLQEAYGGEYTFDRTTVRNVRELGQDRGLEFRYGKDLTDFQQDENVAKTYTGIYPYWCNDEQLVELPGKIINCPGTYDHVRVMPVDLSGSFDEPPTASQLQTAAEAYIEANQIGVPKIEWKIEFAQLPAGAKIGLGDTISVYFVEIGVTGTARVMKTEYDPLEERYTRIYVGRVAPSLAETVAAQGKAQSILERRSNETVIVGDRTTWGSRDGDPLGLTRSKSAPIRDGQLIIDPDNGDMYHDVGGKRIPVGRDNGQEYDLPAMTQSALGGAKAKAKGSQTEYTNPVVIDANGFLWAKVTGTSSVGLATQKEIGGIYAAPVPSDLAEADRKSVWILPNGFLVTEKDAAGGGSSDIFWVRWNVTKFADVDAAYKAGKRLMLYNKSWVTTCSGRHTVGNNAVDYFFDDAKRISDTEISIREFTIAKEGDKWTSAETRISQSGGAAGEDGGYYTPTVSQPADGQMQVSYAASKSGMPSVPSKTITLPIGDPGGYYKPVVTQPTEETMLVRYQASQTGMDTIPDKTIILPRGPKGDGGGAEATPQIVIVKRTSQGAYSEASKIQVVQCGHIVCVSGTVKCNRSEAPAVKAIEGMPQIYDVSGSKVYIEQRYMSANQTKEPLRIQIFKAGTLWIGAGAPGELYNFVITYISV